jgi:hypothetical protein
MENAEKLDKSAQSAQSHAGAKEEGRRMNDE